MATTRLDIMQWLAAAPVGTTHMLVIRDTFDYEDFPRYFTGTADEARTYKNSQDGPNMQKVMEVYNLALSWPEQVNSFRAFNY